MICPNCGKPATFTPKHMEVRGSLGLSYDEDWGMDHHCEEWVECDLCGERTDWAEIASVQVDSEPKVAPI